MTDKVPGLPEDWPWSTAEDDAMDPAEVAEILAEARRIVAARRAAVLREARASVALDGETFSVDEPRA